MKKKELITYIAIAVIGICTIFNTVQIFKIKEFEKTVNVMWDIQDGINKDVYTILTR